MDHDTFLIVLGAVMGAGIASAAYAFMTRPIDSDADDDDWEIPISEYGIGSEAPPDGVQKMDTVRKSRLNK